ncbi:hypothetical protein ABZV60_32830 [Streptomyces sp. NPDC004787]|uniref:hypothetical protein n=1 Tax=Streptomyces sp. NPDC004787 TaxID=3154291 RepID=UPI0033A67112
MRGPAERLALIRDGRLQRVLPLATGLGSAVTGAQIHLEHDRAPFGNRVMGWPVRLGPTGLAAGVAGRADRRAARTVLPAEAAALVANGLQGAWPAHGPGRIPLPRVLDRRLAEAERTGEGGGGEGRRPPEDGTAWRRSLPALDAEARLRHAGTGFVAPARTTGPE